MITNNIIDKINKITEIIKKAITTKKYNEIEYSEFKNSLRLDAKYYLPKYQDALKYHFNVL